MRYQRLADIVELAILLQARRSGMTLDDVQAEFSVSRSTAERMRGAVEAAFKGLEVVDAGGPQRRWRLRSLDLHRLVALSAEELTVIEASARTVERAGPDGRADRLRRVGEKLRAAVRPESLARIESDLETLVHAEGLAMRAGLKPRLEEGLLSRMREAITTCREVEFRYLATATGKRSRRRVRPLGLLYGNRAFLVASSERSEEPRLWRLANVSDLRVTGETFARDPSFNLERYAKRSFGTFQEDPVRVVLRFDAGAARDASSFLFHPDQHVEENGDGSVTVRFEAGGIDEMCWRLFTWGSSVTVEEPARLRERLAQMCATLAAHHQP